MLHAHSRFHHPPTTPPTMDYVLKFRGQPVFSSPQWLEIYAFALHYGYAVNVLGCIFTKMPGVTIQHPRSCYA